MQIVITLPDAYAEIIPNIQNGSIASKIILDAVKDGIVLPKNHGRLIDAKEAEEVMLDVMCGTGNILYLPKSSLIGVEVICDNNFKRIFADDIKIEREFKYVISEKMRQLYKEVIPLSNEY